MALKKYINFGTRVLCLLLVCFCLSRYQSSALARAAQEEENAAAVAEAEAYNAEILEAMEAAEADTSDSGSGYADGTYTGTGTGFGGEIELTVTVEGGEITDISVLSAEGEDPAYYEQALAILDDIKDAQSADVDTISGATFSSTGIRDAVSAALEQAVTK